MTKPPSDSIDCLPQGPYRINGHTVLTEDGTVFAWAHGKTPEQGYAIAREIAAISERMEQINQLAAQLIEAEKYNGWHQQAVLEIERLRDEKAELVAYISSLEKTMTIYADPFAWKEQHDPENSLFVPDHYEVSGFGDMAKFVLAKAANETERK
jgi:hypothetical protein